MKVKIYHSTMFPQEGETPNMGEVVAVKKHVGMCFFAVGKHRGESVDLHLIPTSFACHCSVPGAVKMVDRWEAPYPTKKVEVWLYDDTSTPWGGIEMTREVMDVPDVEGKIEVPSFDLESLPWEGDVCRIDEMSPILVALKKEPLILIVDCRNSTKKVVFRIKGTMHVPKEYKGLLIGKGGHRIKALSQKLGTRIIVK